MKPPRTIRHEFVDSVPRQRAEGVLYISIPFSTSVHSCFCGCGLKVVTPIRPTEWHLTFDGDAVTLWPSVGNWDYPCRSHYWIRGDRVLWAGPMTRAEIEAGRARDRVARDFHYGGPAAPATSVAATPVVEAQPKKKGFWSWLTGDS